jgi:hypothetical protein
MAPITDRCASHLRPRCAPCITATLLASPAFRRAGRSTSHGVQANELGGAVDLTVFPARPAGRSPARKVPCCDDDTGRCDIEEEEA